MRCEAAYDSYMDTNIIRNQSKLISLYELLNLRDYKS